MLDVTTAEKEFGFKAKTTLEEGLKKTINWYREKNNPGLRTLNVEHKKLNIKKPIKHFTLYDSKN
jgi:dTDP-D-glucose 4,6-dehydratase